MANQSKYCKNFTLTAGVPPLRAPSEDTKNSAAEGSKQLSNLLLDFLRTRHGVGHVLADLLAVSPAHSVHKDFDRAVRRLQTAGHLRIANLAVLPREKLP